MDLSTLTKMDNGDSVENFLGNRETFSEAQTATVEVNMESKIFKPWLDKDGNELSVENLRLESKNWDQQTWEFYLESKDAILKEKLMSPGRYSKESAKIKESFLSQLSSGSFLEKSHLESLLRALTPRQRQIIEMIFWQSMSQRQIANALGLNQSTVADVKRSAIRKMRSLVKMTPVTLPICEGPKKQMEDQNDKISA